MSFNYSDDYVNALFFTMPGILKHSVRFSDTGDGTKKNFQSSSFGILCLNLL